MRRAEPVITLRPARDDDYEFFARVYASTREVELARTPWSPAEKAAFLAQQFAAQTAHYASHHATASFEVIHVDGDPAGRLIVKREDAGIHIVDIALLPEHRSRGIGTRLLYPILEDAGRRKATVTIHVERTNPALSLYARLGFRPVADDGIYLLLERKPL